MADSMKRLFKAAEREPQAGEALEVGLAREISRLRAENAKLLDENDRLRSELALTRLVRLSEDAGLYDQQEARRG